MSHQIAPAGLLEELAELSQVLLESSTKSDDVAVRLGQAVVERLEAVGVLVKGAPTRSVYAAIGRSFAEYVLPTPEELSKMSGEVVGLYLDALRRSPADAGLLIAAFGTARLAEFKTDRQLIYRFGGYRGRPGFPLSDHLIEKVIRPATK